jgi:molecular chaperone HtpG
MYVHPLDTVRELVQNAADSVRKAEESSLIKRGAGRIEIELGHNSRSVVVRDNGTGIPTEEIGERLIDVGMSDKDIERDAGFRGIGRLAGIAFCDVLRFRTSAKGESKATVLEFDCVGILKAISPANRRTLEMADVLAKYVTESTEQAKVGDHFFEVTLAGISDSATEFLDIEDVEPYLQQVAPVDFDPQDFLFASKIRSWASKRKLDLHTVSLEVTASGVRRQVFKPYRNSYRTSNQPGGQVDLEIKDVDFVLDDKSKEPRYWIWWGLTDLPGTVGDEKVAGFRLRKNNISLGDPDRVADLFAKKAPTNRRFNAWYIGEIHVLCPRAIPNARRDGFENTGSWPRISEELLPFITERISDTQQTSIVRNLAKKAVKAIGAVETSTQHGLASVQERDTLLDNIQETKSKIASRLKGRAGESDGRELKPLIQKLERAEKKLRDGNHLVAKKLRPSMDKKQKQLLQEITEIVHAVLEQQACKKSRECETMIRKAIMEKFGTS